MKNKPAILSALLLTLVFGGFLAHKTALADTMYSQGQFDDPVYQINNTHNNYWFSLGTSYYGTMKASCWYAISGVYQGYDFLMAQLYENSVNSTSTATFTGALMMNGQYFFNGPEEKCFNTQNTSYVDTPFTFDTSKYYFINFYGWQGLGNGTDTIYGHNGVPYYKFNNDLADYGPNEIEIDYPYDSTTGPDFNAWHISYNYDPSVAETDYWNISVKYSKHLSTCVSWNDNTGCYRDEEPASDMDEGPVTNIPILKLNDLSPGDYNAVAEIYYVWPTPTTVASTSIQFTINNAPAIDTTYYMPTSTWATSTLPVQITCDPNDSVFQYSLCKLFLYLFQPSSASFNQFSTLGDTIKNKAPFGYLSLITTAFNQLSTSTSAFTLTEVSPLVDNIFDPIKAGLTFILWLIFVIWLFNRIRHFIL